jgi:phosphoribosylglycinamide formyltransferase-1
MYAIGWFSTGRGQGSLNLLHAIVGAVRDGRVPARIAYVFCSRELGDAEGSDRYLHQVRDYGLPCVCLSSKRFEPELRRTGRTDPAALLAWRTAYDRAVMERIGELRAQLCIMAGYMLVTGPDLCRAYDIVNLHPAAPGGPAGTWQEVIWQLIDRRADQSGNMMHLVTEELDKGPPVTYSLFSLRGRQFDPLWRDMERRLARMPLSQIMQEEGETLPLFQEIRREGARREIPLVLQTVKAFAEGRVWLDNRRIIAGGRELPGPYCLTGDIEAALTGR